ncbi:hypothetical protein VTK56DRAFT_9359 [Thermocarpiscus australiensis]
MRWAGLVWRRFTPQSQARAQETANHGQNQAAGVRVGKGLGAAPLVSAYSVMKLQMRCTILHRPCNPVPSSQQHWNLETLERVVLCLLSAQNGAIQSSRELPFTFHSIVNGGVTVSHIDLTCPTFHTSKVCNTSLVEGQFYRSQKNHFNQSYLPT